MPYVDAVGREQEDLEWDKMKEEGPTDPRFWACKCDKYFIHAKCMDVVCPLCGAKAKEQSDALVSEIGKGGLFATDDSWLVAYNLSEYYASLDAFDLRKYKKV